MYTPLLTKQKTAVRTEHRKKRPEALGEVVLRPGQDAKIALGTYSIASAKPSFVITYTPGTSEDVKGSLVKIDDDSQGSYHLIYFFQSFCDKTSRVTVQKIAE